MQVQLDHIAPTKNPEERQQILMEHMQTMGENMTLGQQMGMGGDMNCPMHGMMGGGTGMHDRLGRHDDGTGGRMMEPGGHDAMVERMQQMERHMDMMKWQPGTTKPRPPQTR